MSSSIAGGFSPADGVCQGHRRRQAGLTGESKGTTCRVRHPASRRGRSPTCAGRGRARSAPRCECCCSTHSPTTAAQHTKCSPAPPVEFARRLRVLRSCRLGHCGWQCGCTKGYGTHRKVDLRGAHDGCFGVTRGRLLPRDPRGLDRLIVDFEVDVLEGALSVRWVRRARVRLVLPNTPHPSACSGESVSPETTDCTAVGTTGCNQTTTCSVTG